MENTEKNTKIDLKETKEKVVIANDGLRFFERILELNRKYSLLEIFKSVFVTIFIIVVGITLINPNWVVEKYKEHEKATHSEELNKRFEQTQLVNHELEVMMSKLHADRSFFIEYHNSVKSLEGAPFAFGSMDFETTSDEIVFIGDEYTNFSLTKYRMVNYLSNHLLFIGNVSEIEPIDKRLYMKLLSNDINQIALIEVEGTETPLGILGVTWSKHDVLSTYKDQIKKEMRAGATRVALILSKK